jgi:hypothetical protein
MSLVPLRKIVLVSIVRLPKSGIDSALIGRNVAHSCSDHRPGDILDASLDRILRRYSRLAGREGTSVALDHRLGSSSPRPGLRDGRRSRMSVTPKAEATRSPRVCVERHQ